MSAASLYRKLAGIREAQRRAGKVEIIGTKGGRRMATLAAPDLVEGIVASWERNGFTVTTSSNERGAL